MNRHEDDGMCHSALAPTKQELQQEHELEAMEKRIEAHNRNYEFHKANDAYLSAARARVLAMPLPRNECPGCFSAIYDLAAKDGWCTDCNPALRRVDSRTVTPCDAAEKK